MSEKNDPIGQLPATMMWVLLISKQHDMYDVFDTSAEEKDDETETPINTGKREEC